MIGNYPNPFQQKTNVSFNLKNIENAKLLIYNVKGQKVRQFNILNDQSPIIWDGTDENGISVSNGIYFYILKSDGFEEMKKMIKLN